MSRIPRTPIRALFAVRTRLFRNSRALFAEDSRGYLWPVPCFDHGRIVSPSPPRPGSAFRTRRVPVNHGRTPRIDCGFAELFLNILDAKGAAELLGRNERFVRSAAARGRIPGAFRAKGGGRVWLFREAGLRWYVRSRRVGRPSGVSRKRQG